MIQVETSVEFAGWEKIPEVESLIERAVGAAAQVSGARLREGAEVSVLLGDDAAIQAMNRTWRGLDKPTNVLSFPVAVPLDLSQRPMLGDIAIAWETTSREALEEGKPLTAHLTHLVAHGFLHLLGYDHEDDAQAERMEALEIEVLAALDIANPYADMGAEETHKR